MQSACRYLVDLALIDHRTASWWHQLAEASLDGAFSDCVDLEEILKIWFNTNCSQFSFLLDGHTLCSAQSMVDAVATAFTVAIEEQYCSKDSQQRMVFIGKIQIEQIAGDFMESLIGLAASNGIKGSRIVD